MRDEVESSTDNLRYKSTFVAGFQQSGAEKRAQKRKLPLLYAIGGPQNGHIPISESAISLPVVQIVSVDRTSSVRQHCALVVIESTRRCLPHRNSFLVEVE